MSEFQEVRVRKLLDTYGSSIYRLAYSFLENEADAEEIVQDTFLQMLRYQPEFDTAQKEKGWLMKTAANLSRNRLRDRNRQPKDELDENLASEGREDLSFVWDALKTLPWKYRSVIHLFYEEGYSTREIAQILGKKEGSVRSDLTRARSYLKDVLKEAYDFEE